MMTIATADALEVEDNYVRGRREHNNVYADEKLGQ